MSIEYQNQSLVKLDNIAKTIDIFRFKKLIDILENVVL